MGKKYYGAIAMNKWWRARTGKDEGVSVAYGGGESRINDKALNVLVIYARNMSALAESRRAKIEELTADVATLQRALLEAGRSGEP